jgi:hypothetical protein
MNSNFEIKKKIDFKTVHETLLNPKMTNNIVINYKESSQKINPFKNDKPKGYKNYLEIYRRHLFPTDEEIKQKHTNKYSTSINNTNNNDSNTLRIPLANKTTTFYRKQPTTRTSLNETYKGMFSNRNNTEYSLLNYNSGRDLSRGVISRNSNKDSNNNSSNGRINNSLKNTNQIYLKKRKQLINSKDKLKEDLLKNLPFRHHSGNQIPTNLNNVSKNRTQSIDKQFIMNLNNAKSTREKYKLFLKNKSISSSLMMKSKIV